MTREEREKAITDIRDNIKPVVGGKSLDMAIEALEQEPCEDAISRKKVLNQIFYSTDNSGDVVLGSVLRHRIENLPPVKLQEPILDKIRAKIRELKHFPTNSEYELFYNAGLLDALEIIDKYKAEKENEK